MSSKTYTDNKIIGTDLTPVLNDLIKVFDKHHLGLIEIFFLLDVLRSETIDFMNEELNLNEASKHIFNDQ